jgi:K+-transporting ATPase ATPase A chain
MPPIVAGMLVLASLLVALLAIARPLGSYIARVVMVERTVLSPILGPVERGTYRVLGIDADAEQTWAGYAVSVLVFALFSIAFLFVLLLSQGGLPLNPTGAVGMTPDLAFNTAVSFASNTNWQNYAGETGVSHLTQMVGLTVQNFVSAATGLAVAMALVRGLVRRSASTVGDFWVDLVRITLYILLPIAIVAAVFLVSQGVIQTLSGSVTVDTIAGGQQTIALGPVGSQEAIKELGTNGGGFFNANAAHPFENPNPLTDWVQLVLILAIPFALTYTFGRLAGDQRQGWVLFAAMAVILGTAALVAVGSEIRLNPQYAAGIDGALGNMEGKELRFGAVDSPIYAAVTTGTSTGSVNSMHASYLPIGGGVAMVLMVLGEIAPGGVGAGLYGILVFAILAVFIAGLMVGRTPEYLGKKVEAFEMKMAMLVVLVVAASILGFTALASVTPPGLAGPASDGPHGFSEVLYAFTSQSANNGSAFASLTGNSPFYNVFGGVAMLVGRWGMILPILAIAGSMAGKRRVAPSLGTFPTTGPLFVGLLIGVIVIVGALTFFPALALGPVVEELLMSAGVTVP